MKAVIDIKTFKKKPVEEELFTGYYYQDLNHTYVVKPMCKGATMGIVE